jgi:hypothetical protein
MYSKPWRTRCSLVVLSTPFATVTSPPEKRSALHTPYVQSGVVLPHGPWGTQVPPMHNSGVSADAHCL